LRTVGHHHIWEGTASGFSWWPIRITNFQKYDVFLGGMVVRPVFSVPTAYPVKMIDVKDLQQFSLKELGTTRHHYSAICIALVQSFML
jgi:hypothetical protein